MSSRLPTGARCSSCRGRKRDPDRHTETAFRGDPACVAATPAESEYLLETMRHYFPAYRGRVIGTMAGLRVLPHGKGAPQERSRETLGGLRGSPALSGHLRRQAHDLSRDRRVRDAKALARASRERLSRGHPQHLPLMRTLPRRAGRRRRDPANSCRVPPLGYEAVKSHALWVTL